MTRLSWQSLADIVQATNTNLFRKLPDGLTPWHERFLDNLDAEVESALARPHLEQLDRLAQVLCSEAKSQDMATLNLLLELYRVLKLEGFEHDLDHAREPRRVKRALFRELWHLTRRQVQARLGRKVRAVDKVLYEHGELGNLPLFSAWCDGSYRRNQGYAGLLLRDPDRRLLAQASVRVPAVTGHDTEVQALSLVLNTAATLGVRAMNVHVDAAGLAHYAAGTTALRYCVEESVIQRALARFSYVRLTKIPRLYNAEADGLSRSLKD